MSEIGLFEAMYSARALRRLKPDPVPEAIITKILDAAIRAPSAGNSQHWVFMVVRDPELRSALGRIYQKASDIAQAIYQARGRPAHMSAEQYQRMMSAGAYLWEHIGNVPVLLLPCLRDRPAPPREILPPEVQAIYETEPIYTDRNRGASIYPAVQNIILTCRALGLGTLMTNHIRCEGEVNALLGIPDDVLTYALMPIGYPVDHFGSVKCRPVNEVAYADRWAPLGRVDVE